MHRPEWMMTHMVDPAVLSEVPLAHSIPYEWGALHVSAGAYEAYGIQPLRVDLVREVGLTPQRAMELTAIKREPRIDVMFVGPHEEEESLQSLSMIGPNESRMAVRTRPGGFGLTLRFGSTRTEFVRTIEDQYIEMTRTVEDGPTREEILDGSVELSTGLPIRTFAANNASRLILEQLVGTAADGIKIINTEWMRDESGKQFSRIMNVVHGIGLACIALDGGEILSGTTQLPDTLTIPLAVAAVAFISGNRIINRYNSRRKDRERLISRISAMRAIGVKTAILSTYSHERFEEEFGPRLEDQ